jgi:polyferredoxin
MTVKQPASRRPWLRRWGTWRATVQGMFLVTALIIGLRYALVANSPSIEAYCPFGGLETTWAVITRGELLRNLAPTSGLALLLVLIATVLLGRVFCGWVCPLGTLQDVLTRLGQRVFGKQWALPLQPSRTVDRLLRFKVLVLGWVLWASVTAVVPPLAPFCPLRTVFDFHWGSLLSLGVIVTWGVSSLIVERFLCRYLCPLGALLALLNLISPWRPRVAATRCVTCGRCSQACPAGIDPVRDGTQHPECVRCYACVDACRIPGAMRDH